MLVNGTVLPVVSMTPVVPSACCTTLCTCEEDSAVAVAAAPLIVPAAVMVYVPSGNVAPVLSVGVQPVIGTVPAACGPRSIVLTTWPALFVTLTVMSPSAFAVCAPKALALPPITVIVLPGASTVAPISDAACADCPADNCVASELSEVFNWPMPDTVLICASCEVICELSVGFVGSWFCSCVTSSVRKVFCRSAGDCVPVVLELELADEVPDVLDVPDVLEVPFMVFSSVCDIVAPLLPIVVLVVTGLSSGSDRQGLKHQLLGGIERFHIRLIRTRRRNHVDHFLHRIDVRQGHVAVRVCCGIGRVVGSLHRRRVVNHARHLHAAHLLAGRRARAAERIDAEHHLLRLVWLAVRAGRAVRVGQVRGGHVQALRLRGHRRAGNVEDVHQRGHCFSSLFR